MALGDLLAGLPINSSDEFTGSFWDLLTPYGLWFGITLLVLCLLHGATFLGLKTDGPGAGTGTSLAGKLVWPSAVLVVIYAIWTVAISDGGALADIAAAVPVLAALAAALFIRSGHEGRSFTATAVAIGGNRRRAVRQPLSQRHGLLDDTANNLTVAGTASSDYALKVMTVVALVMTPIVLLYQGWSYWVFRARVSAPPAPASPLGRQPARALMSYGV